MDISDKIKLDKDKLNPKQRIAFNKICDCIGEGESLRKACEPDDVPNISTILRWLKNDENGSLCTQYARAREAQADYYAELIIGVAQDDENDTPDKINRARVKIDAYKWTAAKLRPGTYGDQRDQNATAASVTVVISGRDADCG